MPRAARTTVAPNIYADATGLAAVARVGSRTREKRFPAGTSLRTIQTWIEDTKTALRKEVAREGPVRGDAPTLKQDVEAYLRTIRGSMPSWKSRRSELHAWAAAFAKRPRLTLTRLDIAEQLNLWARRGVAVRTVNKRRNALIQLYVALDGPEAPNPVRETRRLREPDREARGLPYEDLVELLGAIPDRGRPTKGTGKKAGQKTSGHPPISLTKLRLVVMLYTGLPPIRIGRLKPEDLDLAHARVWLAPRRKGGGRPGKWQPLTTDGVRAFEAFAAAKAFGEFSSSSARKSLLLARKAVNVKRKATKRPLIPPLRPYDLRHSFGTQALRVTRDIRAVQELLDHADIRTTLQYVEAAVSETERAAVEALSGHQGPALTLPDARANARRGTKRGTVSKQSKKTS